jgi:hypothetical protein
MNPFAHDLPPIGAGYDAPFSASSRFPSSSYGLHSYDLRPDARPQTNIGKSMPAKPARRDIRESIQSKPTMNDIRKTTFSEDVERGNSKPVQPSEDYVKAHDFVACFKSWRSGKPTPPNSDLSKKFTASISTEEWVELTNEFQLSESNDQLVSLLQNLFLFY